MGVAIIQSESAKLQPGANGRKIIHVDMDCFYAAVEMRDNPEWKGRPLIVGGRPGGRGVVATANYEARRFGIHSAMPTSRAYRLCPQAVFVRPNFTKYQEASQVIRTIFGRFTSLIEPLSLDEAYLDVTDNSRNWYATRIAAEIRRLIFAETGLTASAGVGPNKLIAKIASDMNKPNGMTVVQPHQVAEFMAPLPLRKIPGVGPATEKRLQALGLNICQDVLTLGESKLLALTNSSRMTNWLWQRAQGIDTRPISMSRRRKSMGQEDTFAKDLKGQELILEKLEVMKNKLFAKLMERGFQAKTVTIKVRYENFQTITRTLSADSPWQNADSLAPALSKLLERTEADSRAVRLLGVSFSNLSARS